MLFRALFRSDLILMDHPDTAPSQLDLAAIGARIREAISASGTDGTGFAERVGVPYSTMRSYLSGNRPPSAEFLAGSFTAYGVMPSWLLTGEAPMRRTEASTTTSEPDPMAEFIAIPRLPIQVSAGYGSVNEPPVDYPHAGLCFSRGWLARRRLSPHGLRVVEVKGRSMDGVLADGDLVLIDMSDTKPRSGFVYVLRQGDELLVKYCQLLPGGVLRVSSANTQFAPYDVVLNESSDVEIVGRVVASMHEW